MARSDRQKGAGAVAAGEPQTTAAEATPSMAQYLEIKAANPDSILWYRMGDFYELFFADAVVVSQALGIVLTKRGKHLGEDIPMCGVPVHRADEYLQRLIRQGYRVAVCEQMEDPAEARKRGSKAVVRRDVVRLVTPGTLTEDSLLDAGQANRLVAMLAAPAAKASRAARQVALAAIDISTGEFEVGAVAEADLPGELVRLAARELLMSDGQRADPALATAVTATAAALTPTAAANFDADIGERLLGEWLGVADLGGIGTFDRLELAAVAALLRYVELTQIGARPRLMPPRRLGGGVTLVIDAATRASLELTRSTSGERRGSLIGAIDRTVTGAGARELAARLAAPLTDPAAIAARLDAVSFLVDAPSTRAAIRDALAAAPDLARAASRLALDRGSPRDLGAIRDGLGAAACAGDLIAAAAGAIGLPTALHDIAARLGKAPRNLASHLTAALADDLPILKRDGGFIRTGYSQALDEARALKENGRQVMAALEARYQAETGIRTLKIRHNNILGYYVEVGQASAGPLTKPPLADTFRHRQTMANAMRFVTDTLLATEGQIASAAERAQSLEQELYAALAREVRDSDAALGEVAGALAELDVQCALAQLAEAEAYCRPVLDESDGLDIRGGRHPVVEQALKADRAPAFIANDCVLGATSGPVQVIGGEPPSDMAAPAPGFGAPAPARVWLVTGPNMAGKSTFLRQNALIVVLAQMGSFVPAAAARIGIVDRLFSRVGAADDLARGRSTFMVEMVETAAILNSASARSLVILDEIGRGTATYDGLAIAWASLEHLIETSRCRALFATHYHELTVLPERYGEVANVTVDVKEWKDEIVFLHKVKAGAADRSYGIQVAKLAGLPRSVIARASEVLTRLERSAAAGGGGAAAKALIEELPLFAAARDRANGADQAMLADGVAGGARARSEVERAIDALDPDDLTPKAALEALYHLKALREQ